MGNNAVFVAEKLKFTNSILLFYLLLSLRLKPNQSQESNSDRSCASEQLVPTQRSSSFQT